MRPTSSRMSEKLAAIADDIRAALELALGAEKAVAASDLRTAATLQDGADHACTSILRQITQLDEQQADSIEPAFTRFEQKLVGLTRTLRKDSQESRCSKTSDDEQASRRLM